MRYSTRTRYGLRLLVNLASRPADSCVQLAEIARDEGISVKYLEQIVRALRPSGILRSIRGARGGYALARPASEIFMDVVVEYLEGHIAPVDCLYADAPCPRQNTCSTRAFWLEMDRHMRAFLARTTLARFVEDTSVRGDGCPFADGNAEEEPQACEEGSGAPNTADV